MRTALVQTYHPYTQFTHVHPLGVMMIAANARAQGFDDVHVLDMKVEDWTPEKAVDRAIASGRLSARLPFIRREAVRLLKVEQATEQAALDAIARELQKAYPASAIAAVQGVYRTSIFPVMKVVPGAYPDNIGHMTSNGCFRCHDGSHMAKDGASISGDCEYCHVQVEEPPTPTTAAAAVN